MSGHVWGESETQYFYHLDPSTVLNAIDSLGVRTTGRCLTLNSMENRVYEVEIESNSEITSDHFVVAKFYRPGRWSREQILDEHKFLLDLEKEEIPVIAPKIFNGETLFQLDEHELFFTLFPKKGGRIPDEMNEEQLEIVGRTIARIHNVGARGEANHRLEITPTTFGTNNLALLLQTKMLPPQFETGFAEVIENICKLSTPLFNGIKTHRIHGDCHKSNIIYREFIGPSFIDFDDMLTGPAVQDIWLIVPGDDPQSIENRTTLLASYELMRDFDYRSLKLIEPLRALRYIHFAAWISKRWGDPAFKHAFPYFGSDQYWSTLTSDLHIQLQKIQAAGVSPHY